MKLTCPGTMWSAACVGISTHYNLYGNTHAIYVRESADSVTDNSMQLLYHELPFSR